MSNHSVTNKLVIKRGNVKRPPIVVDDFTSVEFYDSRGELKAFIQRLGTGTYSFSSEADPDWKEAKATMGMNMNLKQDLEKIGEIV